MDDSGMVSCDRTNVDDDLKRNIVRHDVVQVLLEVGNFIIQQSFYGDTNVKTSGKNLRRTPSSGNVGDISDGRRASRELRISKDLRRVPSLSDLRRASLRSPRHVDQIHDMFHPLFDKVTCLFRDDTSIGGWHP